MLWYVVRFAGKTPVVVWEGDFREQAGRALSASPDGNEWVVMSRVEYLEAKIEEYQNKIDWWKSEITRLGKDSK